MTRRFHRFAVKRGRNFLTEDYAWGVLDKIYGLFYPFYLWGSALDVAIDANLDPMTIQDYNDSPNFVYNHHTYIPF